VREGVPGVVAALPAVVIVAVQAHRVLRSDHQAERLRQRVLAAARVPADSDGDGAMQFPVAAVHATPLRYIQPATRASEACMVVKAKSGAFPSIPRALTGNGATRGAKKRK